LETLNQQKPPVKFNLQFVRISTSYEFLNRPKIGQRENQAKNVMLTLYGRTAFAKHIIFLLDFIAGNILIRKQKRCKNSNQIYLITQKIFRKNQYD